ncbi:hypothetical protein HMPREF0742_00797 [Rothia aeria F0184]|uniref:Uncharacterized protein n=1 Tax=Rothia aeria F0184 TaxID=888019 RepID=U7V6L2_9MICC|nr:hypothetical protein HMPREF0742_00797 [Rothia aeria F0184]
MSSVVGEGIGPPVPGGNRRQSQQTVCLHRFEVALSKTWW